MAPALITSLLNKRQYCDGYYNYNNCNGSGWSNWGRWVALGVIVVAFIILALAFSCFNNRRRRRRGAPPMYGTAWLPAYSKYGGNQPYYGGAAAPPYSPPIENQTTGHTFNSNEGYYGNQGYGQNGGIELQPPTNAYQPQRGGDPVYDAPSGPPPGKGGNYVVR